MATSFSPSMSEDDGSVDMSTQSWQAHDAPSPTGSNPSPDDDQPDVKLEDSATDAVSLAEAAGESSSAVPVHKRRRVTRACDECRRKKIKCDGKQPCTHCSVYSYDCTYDKPSNRRRNPAPQYVEALESRLQRAETLLRTFVPDVDLSDPSLDASVQQEFRNRDRMRAQAAKTRLKEQRQQEQEQEQQQQQQQQQQQLDLLPSQQLNQHQKPQPKQQASASGRPGTEDGTDGEELMSMIETIDQLDLTEGGEWDFHGTSSGAVFLRKMKKHFHGLLGRDSLAPYLPRPPRPPGLFDLDSPQSAGSSPWGESSPSYYNLPPKEHARALCYFSLNCATCLLRTVHVPSFYEMFDRLYEQAPDSLGPDDHKQLGLLYSVLALGCMYNISEESDSNPTDYRAAMDEGLKYYTVTRILLQDITDCRDLTSLQALVYMILFLQATSNLSACYSFIGIALRAALRMGLHRNLPHAKLTAIESESRRRVFYVIRQMDTYVSALLGFPMPLRDDDVDQHMPTEVDDEYITKDGIITPPPGTPSFFQACNAHSRLMAILTKVIRCIYPVQGIEQCISNRGGTGSTYMISYSEIKVIENDLKKWLEELPAYWRPSSDGPIEVVRVRTLLRFAYAHVQMMMYRPFLHYVSPRIPTGKSVDGRYYACAAAAVSVSRNIVHIALGIRKQAVLIGPYWFILYSEFFAILSLVYYALENPDRPGTSELMADAISGREAIASLSKRSMAADRITAALNTLFERLPAQLKMGKARPSAPTRKRSATGPKGAQEIVPSPPSRPKPKGKEAVETSRPARADPMHEPPQHHKLLDTAQQHQEPQQQTQPVPQLLPQPHDLPQSHLPGNLHNHLAMEMPSGAESSDSSGTPLMSQQPLQTFPVQPTPRTSVSGMGGLGHGAAGSVGLTGPNPNGLISGAANPLYKLDAMMFPSSDPFAYPSQPMIEFDPPDLSGGMGGGRGGSSGLGNNPSEAHIPSSGGGGGLMPQFYTAGLFGDIEGQLLGPVPEYLMQTSGTPMGADLAYEMYNASSLLMLQQTQMNNTQPPLPSTQAQTQTQTQPQSRTQGPSPSQQQQQLEGVFASNAFGMFPGQYPPQPPM